ncbi:hypothetical protein GGI20_002018 [Coemansia sp. BCRC 34301]|nr:hypothetical protein GGI20_002018 [Coemansia sp. BCRC 34301]
MRASVILSRSRRRIGDTIRRFLLDNNYLCDEYFATSYIVPQRALLGIRVAVFVYCATVLVSNLVANIVHEAGWSWPAYFTTLTYFGVTLYYWFAAYNTARHLRRNRGVGRRPSAGVSGCAISHPAPLPPDQLLLLAAASARVFGTPELLAVLDSRANGSRGAELDHIRLCQPSANTNVSETIGDTTGQARDKENSPNHASKSMAHQLSLAIQWILYELFTCYAPLVSLVYWAILYPTQGGLDSALNTWMGVSMHGVNTVLMALEVLVFARCPYRWTHVSVVLGVLVAYLVLVYLMVGAYGFYVYPFFEAEYFGVGGVVVICALVTMSSTNGNSGDKSSEKREHLEPARESNSQAPRADYFASVGRQEEESAQASSSRVPPAYTDMDHGFNDTSGSSVVYPLYSPPYNAPYQAPAPVDEPIFLTLLNPRLISSGFTMSMPDGLHRLAPRAVDATKWTAFMQELNDVLHKAPGSVVQEISDFWLVHAVTLGLAWHARNMFQTRIEGKAAAVIERYNRAEFAAWGIRVHFDIVPVVDATASSEAQRRDRRQRRDDRRSSGTHANSTLELVIERA